jgi:serine-type D-Ala-D-Ala carboxypeptidase/endopeptidase
MKIRNLTLLFLLAATAVLPQQAPLLNEGARSLAIARVGAGVYPSLVIGVVQADREEIVGLGSCRDSDTHRPDGDTVYEIGSVTKTFTALLLADAVQRHEVALDQPAGQLLPGYVLPSSGGRAITLLDLATHRSGLPRLPDNLLPSDPANPYADYTVLDLKRFLAGFRLQSVPGEHYEYSNLGFGLLGQALTTRAGTGYEALLANRITTPLGMRDTGIALSPRMAEHFASGHDASGKPARPWDLDALQGAGAVRSTVHDLLLYLRAAMHPGTQPLAGALSLATRPQRPTDQESTRIALAWQVESRQGRVIVWHNGMTGGCAAFVGFTADGERGVVVLSNISRDVGELARAALLPETMAQEQPKEVALPREVLVDYVGRFRLAPGFDLEVSLSATGLQAQATGQPALPVFASARDEFFYKVVVARLSFTRDATGRVTSVTLHQNGRDMPAPRVEDEVVAAPTALPEIRLDDTTLQGYAGTYRLVPGFSLKVTVSGGQLYVQATGQERFPVFATARDEFFYKVVQARLSFRRAGDGTVELVVLHQNGQDITGRREHE